MELEAQRSITLFRQVLDLPTVDASTSDVDCPVCETPGALTQERIQAIRDKVRDTEGFRATEMKAKQALASLSSSVEALATAATSACPEFFKWNRARRIEEGFRTNRLAPLLDEEVRLLLGPWFRAATAFIRRRQSVLGAAAEASSAISAARADLPLLSDYAAIREKIEPLASKCEFLVAAIAEYQLRADPLAQPLRDAVAKESDTTGWADLIAIGRGASDIVSESREIEAHAELLVELEAACRQVETAKETVLEDRFDALANDIRSWWDLLRPEEAAFFTDLGLRKKAQRTIDLKAGLAPSTDQKHPKIRHAVAVFSQSQLHCLGLATFFARTSCGGGFLVLDDPIIAIDDDYSVHFITAVLAELQARDVQVIMLTHNRKTWTATQSRYSGGLCEAFQLHLNDPLERTTVLKSSDTLAAMLKACEPFTTSSMLEHRKDGCQKIRDCAERFCKELLVQERQKQGDAGALISEYTGPDGMLGVLIPQVTLYLASGEPGKLNMVRDLTNPGNHDDDVPAKEGLKVCLGDLRALKKAYLS